MYFLVQVVLIDVITKSVNHHISVCRFAGKLSCTVQDHINKLIQYKHAQSCEILYTEKTFIRIINFRDLSFAEIKISSGIVKGRGTSFQ